MWSNKEGSITQCSLSLPHGSVPHSTRMSGTRRRRGLLDRQQQRHEQRGWRRRRVCPGCSGTGTPPSSERWAQSHLYCRNPVKEHKACLALFFKYYSLYHYFSGLSLPSGELPLSLNEHTCSCLCAVWARLASLRWQALYSFEIQKPSPLQRCSSSGHWGSSQDMAEEGRRNHHNQELCLINSSILYISSDIIHCIYCFCCLPQAFE